MDLKFFTEIFKHILQGRSKMAEYKMPELTSSHVHNVFILTYRAISPEVEQKAKWTPFAQAIERPHKKW